MPPTSSLLIRSIFKAFQKKKKKMIGEKKKKKKKITRVTPFARMFTKLRHRGSKRVINQLSMKVFLSLKKMQRFFFCHPTQVLISEY
jgi:hypothetical protein